jgi:hypothetical protein
MYGGIMSLQELSTTFSNITKGRYYRALIFLPGTCSLSLFSCIHNLSPTLTIFSIFCWSCLTLYFSCELFNVFCTCKWICLIFYIIFSSFNESPMRPSIVPPCFPYKSSKGEGGKYPKQVSKGELPV